MSFIKYKHEIKNVKRKNILKHINKRDVKKEDKYRYNNLENFINNNIDENKDYYWQTGYETFGPLLFGYASWLKLQFENKKYNHIYFLSRDGYIMQKAYNIVQPNNSSKYIYASRRSLIVPTIWLYKNLNEILENISFANKVTVEEFLKKMGLEPKKYEDIIKKYNYKLKQIITIEQIRNEKIEFYEEIKKDIYENSKKEYMNLLRYYKSIGFKENVAIIDIGWYGNMQNALEKIRDIEKLNVNIDGYYVGLIPNSEKQQRYSMKGYLFERGREKLFLKMKYFNSLFEMIFLAHHGSVKRYTETADNIELYPYEYDKVETDKNLKKFQDGALQFVKDFSNSKLNKNIKFDENLAMFNLIELGNRPKKEDIEKFGNMEFYDNVFYKLVQTKSIRYYIFHLKDLINDIKSSPWRPAILKSIFKVNLPYLKMLICLEKIKIKGRK